MAEAASVGSEGAGEGLFTGVTERGMAEIVPEGDGLGQVFVEVEGAGYSTRDLHHLQGMGEAVAGMVGLRGGKNLGLFAEATENLCVGDSLPVALGIGWNGRAAWRERV